MIFRDLNTNVEKPYHDGKWIYPDSIYENVEQCFLRTQRPIGVKEYKDNRPRLLDPFRKINKFKMQDYFNKDDYKELDWVTDKDGTVRAAIIYHNISKMSSKKKIITSFTQRKIELGENDSYIFDVACDIGYEEWLRALMEKHYAKTLFGTTVAECDMQNKQLRSLFESLGFERIDNKVSSFADMYGIWCKQNNLFPIKKIEQSQECSLQRLIMLVPPTQPLVKQNKEKLDWVVKDTPLRKKLSEVEAFIDLLNVDDSDIERIRILKLGKDEGELERHTDIQDKEAGINDGQWARLHFPLVTNSLVFFTQWNTDGTKTIAHMDVGELWYLDMRKPHTAINHGDEDRYHLVIDIRADERLRDWLRRSEKTYPPEKGNTDW